MVYALSSPTKIVNIVKGQYKRIVDRVRDDPILAEQALSLPNINAKSITSFVNKQEKRANYLATSVPKVPTHRRVVSDVPIPEADTLPSSLPSPSHAEVQYSSAPPEFGKRRGEKRRLQFDDDVPHSSMPTNQPAQSEASTSTKTRKLQSLAPKASFSQASPRCTDSVGCAVTAKGTFSQSPAIINYRFAIYTASTTSTTAKTQTYASEGFQETVCCMSASTLWWTA